MSADVAFWKVGEVSRRARPGVEQITGPVVRENMPLRNKTNARSMCKCTRMRTQEMYMY